MREKELQLSQLAQELQKQLNLLIREKAELNQRFLNMKADRDQWHKRYESLEAYFSSNQK